MLGDNQPVRIDGSSVGMANHPTAEAERAAGASELTRRCVATSAPDPNQPMAFTAGIAALCLSIGIVGLFTRPIRPAVLPPPPDEPVPVLFEPPPPAPVPTQALDAEKPETDQPSDAVPQVVAVAPANAAVSFSVPTIGVVVPVKLASAPPPRPMAGSTVKAATPKAVEFKGVGTSGNFPKPKYPPEALRRRLQGVVILDALIDSGGNMTKLNVQESSGFPLLDNAALEIVNTSWKWPSGENRHYIIPFDFNLPK